MNVAILAGALGGAALAWPGRRSRDGPARAGRLRSGEARADRPNRRRGRSLRGGRAVVTVSVVALCVVLCGATLGLVLAAGAVPLSLAGLSRMATPSGSPSGSASRLPFVLDLAAAVLRGGAPVSVALEQAAVAGDEATAVRLVQVARLLRLGAAPAEVWGVLETDPRLAALAAVSRRSAVSGVRLARGWEQLAAELRSERRAAALARAHRAGVWAMAPLGLCFLPAFVCLGVVPDVLGVAREVLGGAV